MEEQIVELNHLLNDKKCEVKKTSAESIEKEKSHFTENNNLKQQLNQKDTMLKEYQSQVYYYNYRGPARSTVYTVAGV